MTVARFRPTRVEVDLAAVAANVEHLVAGASPAELCVVVKADGYGHGAVPVARAALAAGATSLAVALVEEALELREAGVTAPVLVLSRAPHEALAPAVAAEVSLTVDGEDAVDELAAAVAVDPPGRPVGVHLKVDTGMHRMGASPEAATTLARRIVASDGLALAGTWTHLARADEPEVPTTDLQLDRFDAVLAELRAAGIDPGRVHAANSAGALAHPRARYDMVRCGIAAYGIAPAEGLVGTADLRPALSWTSAVSATRLVPAGDGVSYGHRWTAGTDTTIATVPVGYADGVRRDAGVRGVEVLVGGRRRRIVGNVTMDQLLIDVGDDEVHVGDEVVLIGRQGDEVVTAAEWADHLDTIPYEVVCAVGARVPRHH